MKKYIVSFLIASIFLAGMPIMSQRAYASEMSVRDFIKILIIIGVIPPEKISAVNTYLDSLDKVTPSIDNNTSVNKPNPTPTCYLKTNKSSYKLGDTIYFTWKSSNASYANFLQDNSGKDHLSLPGDKLEANGSQEVVASVVGSPTVTLSVSGVNGASTCNRTIEIIDSPSCTITTDRDSYNYGEEIVLSWNSKNATYATFWQDDSGKDHLSLPGDKLDTSGSQTITANVVGNPFVKLLVHNYNNSGSCSVTIPVNQ